ncbi:MAG: ABC transporter permease [Anaerolineales bacterium]|nr:ABC transporter permease [Anaerolineales bacterium]
MRNIWLVIKHDVSVTLRQVSFWILTIIMPLILVGINAYLLVDVNDGGAGDDAETSVEQQAQESAALVFALVDEGGLINDYPALVTAEMFPLFPDESSALAALDANEVMQVVVIPADYVATGELTIYAREFQITMNGQGMGVAFDSNEAWLLSYLLDYNLTGDEQLVQVLRDPINFQEINVHALNPPEVDPAANSELMATLVASMMPYVFYFLLVMGGNYMMRSVVAEKENRTVELLLLSVNPQELMIGKMVAMSLVMLIQVVVWVGSSVLLLDRARSFLTGASFDFPPGFLFYAILFLVLGYLLYAAIMSMAGAIAPNAREGAQLIWLLIIPLMPTLMFGQEFLQNPHGTLSLVLSLFPLSSPSAMVTRIAVAEVPFWQIGLSLGLLALTTYGFILLAGRFFRTDNLLSDASLNVKRLLTGWRS